MVSLVMEGEEAGNREVKVISFCPVLIATAFIRVFDRFANPFHSIR